MSQNRTPLRVNVGFLLNQSVGASRDIHFDFPDIRLRPDLDLTDFSGLLRLGRAAQGIVVQGSFSGKIDADCVRCLSSFKQTLHTEFSELYAFRNKPVSDSGLVIPEDGFIDFEPLIWEYLTLEIPISPICRDDCKGLCSICGENLNEKTCEHHEPAQSSPNGSSGPG